MGNGLVHITTASFTTQSSVSIDNCFSATYTHYLVKRNLLGSTGGNAIQVRLRVGGVDTSAANYREQYLTAQAASVSAARNTGLTTWEYAGGYTEATTYGYAELWVSNPFEAVRTTAWTDIGNAQSGSIQQWSLVYAHDLTTSYDGLTVYPASGTITGSISVWGLAKA